MSTTRTPKPLTLTSGDLGSMDAGELREHVTAHVVYDRHISNYADRIIRWLSALTDIEVDEIAAEIEAETGLVD